MAASQFADDLVRDYLRYRGFFASLKAFDSEVKADKDKGFRPDRVVEHLSACIESMDLVGLRDTWSHLDSHIFRRLEQSFIPTVRKLEMALLRMYVVACVTNSRQDKLTEFFDKMAPELHFQAEWKEWFALPFLKCVEDNPNFQVYFTRQWQEMMIISLRNFLSVVYQSMALPTLLSYDEDMNKMQFLQEENESLKQQLAAGRPEVCETADVLVAPEEPMDDFYVIAQETPAAEGGRKILPALMRTFGNIQTSPVTGRKLQADQKKQTSEEQNKTKRPPANSTSESQTLPQDTSTASSLQLKLVYGLKQGNLRLYDIKERRALFDIVPESASVLKEHSVACLACSPVEPVMVSSLHSEPSLATTAPAPGKLLLWDLKSKQLQGHLKCSSSVNCCVFSHNGQLLLCGTSGGNICLFDVRTHECITNWVAHESEVFSVQFSRDEATCFSIGAGGTLSQWNVYKTGQKVADFPLHAGCMGPSGFRPVGKLFSLGADSEHILTCAPTSGIVYKEENGSFTNVLSVGDHKSHVVTVDWSPAVDCSTCATASVDGSISIATLFSHV
ncbi:WD repeat-containing protein 91 isoform X5 [Dermacentor variabilis]|uniref:WD repeat-containing protein 91 isoform X5 n=1 Tax=Dermacentor variabilis TaxID=34621 RepID=UPI003F5B28AB